MPIIASGDERRPQADDTTLTTEDLQLMDLLALHVVCDTLREVRR